MNDSKQLLKVYGVCVIGMVVGSFISPLIRLLINMGVDSAVITFYRMLFCSALLLPVLFSKKENRDKVRAMKPKVLWVLLGYSICKCVGLLTWAEAINNGASAFIVNTLGNMSTIFVVAFAWIFLGEKISRKSMLGIFICLAGVIVIGLENLSSASSAVMGIVLIFISATFNAGNTVFGRAVRKGLDLLPLLGVDYALGTLITGTYAAARGADFTLPPKALLYMALLSWLCTLFCHSVPIWALRYARPASVSVINLAGPFITAIIGFFLLGEVPRPMMYVGAVIMVFGLGYYVLVEQKESLKVKVENEQAETASAAK